MICAVEKDKSACWGDYGSPLVQNGVLVGLSSNGPGQCADEKIPWYYTRIGEPEIRMWINHTADV